MGKINITFVVAFFCKKKRQWFAQLTVMNLKFKVEALGLLGPHEVLLVLHLPFMVQKQACDGLASFLWLAWVRFGLWEFPLAEQTDERMGALKIDGWMDE